MTRMIHVPGTRDYVAKRTQEGRSYREIRRSLKRYLARTLYRQLNPLCATAGPTPSHAAGRTLLGICQYRRLCGTSNLGALQLVRTQP